MLAGILERWRGIQVESYTTGKEVGELIKKPTSRLPLTRGRKSPENRPVLNEWTLWKFSRSMWGLSRMRLDTFIELP